MSLIEGSGLLDGQGVSSAAQDLLRWYDSQKRSLPWRLSRDPYRIWLSEVMLQQTQVQTVIPYYEAFVARFPTIDELASAPLDEVLAMWSGLGYYRRARLLHRGAQEIAALGSFPESARELKAISGIGDYTSAAVASIAFGERVPVLDGNVERVLCRFFALDKDPKRSAARRFLLEKAAEMLDLERPGDSNQALMELGATVCRPKRPACLLCPLIEACHGRRQGNPEAYPLPRRRRDVLQVELAVGVALQGGRILLFQRPEESELLAGMWELPSTPWFPDEEAIEAALGEHYGGIWKLQAKLGEVRHTITYREIHLHLYPASVSTEGAVRQGPKAAWVGYEDRERYPLSSMVEKIWRRFRES